MNVALDNYSRLMGQSAAVGSPREQELAELARIAESLGRRFEARGWWSIRARQRPDDQAARAGLDRLAHREVPSATRGQTLADLIPVPLLAAPAVVDHGLTPSPTTPAFRDDAQAVGLRFVYDNDPTPLCRLPETMGGGIGVLDYDGDGWLDVYAVGGGSLSDKSIPLTSPQRDRLFRNNGDATFVDVTERAGLAAVAGGYGHGVAVGDYDNDGRPDVFVSRWRSYALYRNRSDGTFEDVTEAAGLGGPRDWPTSAAFGDLDGDGDLDLYVCHYTDWDSEQTAPCPHPNHPDRNGYCVPRGLGSMPDHVFRNDSGRFVDVSDQAGVREADRDGRGLGVVIADLDDDGRPLPNSNRCQFIFPSEDDPADGGLTRCSIVGLSVPSIPEPRVAGRSARNHAPTSTRLLFAHHRLSLATACAVPPRSVPVRPTRETGLRADRHVPSHGKGNSTTDNPRGPRPTWPGLGWPRCTAERPANEHLLE